MIFDPYSHLLLHRQDAVREHHERERRAHTTWHRRRRRRPRRLGSSAAGPAADRPLLHDGPTRTEQVLL